jgi:ABC-type branched-subunit amino acid transport system substrate-binding protein
VGSKAQIFCPGDPLGQSPYAVLMKQANDFDAKIAERAASFVVVAYYDNFMAAKAAAEGAGSLDGRKMVDWLENNSSSLRLVGTIPHISASSHYMNQADSNAMVQDLGSPRSDGLYRRSDCQ